MSEREPTPDVLGAVPVPIADIATEVRQLVPIYYSEPHELANAESDMRACAKMHAGGFWQFCHRELGALPAELAFAITVVADELTSARLALPPPAHTPFKRQATPDVFALTAVADFEPGNTDGSVLDGIFGVAPATAQAARRPSELRPHPLNEVIYGDRADADLVASIRAKGVLNP